MLKAVILIGGPQKGTRFRPLSFDLPKPLFPVAGIPMVQHLIEAFCKVPNMREILMIGFYQLDEALNNFIAEMVKEFNITIRYLQEYEALGTGGGIYHFRDQICSGDPEAFFVINGDVCGDFPLVEMINFHRKIGERSMITVLGTEATRQQSLNYGCIVEDKDTHEVKHYVEKPSTFVSQVINCGVYVCSLEIFQYLASVFNKKQQHFYNGDDCLMGNHAKDRMQLEKDVLMPLSATGQFFVYQTSRWWSQMKTAGSAIYANRHYLLLYQRKHPKRLAKNGENKPTIIGDVYIHPNATVHPTATLGPNVSIGHGANIGAGVRIRESIILGADHTLIIHSIVGWNSTIGEWARVEGTLCDPNPNKPFAKMENLPLFNSDGRLNPSITILGSNVKVPSEVIVLNTIVLPHKDLSQSYKNEIIL